MLDRYGIPRAFRQALEARLMAQSKATGIDLGRLRRQVSLERLLARLAEGQAGRTAWVLKFHALTRIYGDRPNTRVKDLVDLVLLTELNLIDPTRLTDRVRTVFRVRATHPISRPAHLEVLR